MRSNSRKTMRARALACHDAQLDFGDVEPAAVLWCVMDFEAAFRDAVLDGKVSLEAFRAWCE